ncbi:hypothetical protein BSLA_02f4894 [Burkholderia stabilis]|nr:hypothetical protein BSLA_02f4894 [Burkholderia stabilis]
MRLRRPANAIHFPFVFVASIRSGMTKVCNGSGTARTRAHIDRLQSA